MISFIRPMAILLALAALAGTTGADQSSLPNGEITIGSVTLQACNYPKGALCGRLDRPLDSAGETPGSITIRFEWYGHRNASEPARGTIVAVSGGPGGATTVERDHYLNLFDGLLDDWNLLLADNRGTGGSGAIFCAGLHSDEGWTPENISACGQHLGDASDLYGTADAADDLAALIGALQIPGIDLYGASYGGYFAQVFAARHPNLLRSIVLDGPLAVWEARPENAEMMPAIRRSLDTVCRRSPGCSNRPGSPNDRLTLLIERARVATIGGMVTYPLDELSTYAEVTAGGLMNLVTTNYMGPVELREIDAALRAYLEHRDSWPILRLIAESYAVLDPTAFPADEFSEGLFLAAQCTDYRLDFRTSQPLYERQAQLNAAISQMEKEFPEAYAPFTVDEYWRIDGRAHHPCLYWPAPSATHPQGQPLAPDAVFPDVPVLVLSGEFDSVAPAEEAAVIAELFPRGRHVVFANSLHIVADDKDGCAARMITLFIAELDAGPSDCARAAPPIRTVPSFAAKLDDVEPAISESDDAEVRDLRIAAAAVRTVADVMYRWFTDWDGAGAGLRGGHWRFEEDANGLRYELDRVRWTVDTAVSGQVYRDWSGATSARVTVAGPGDLLSELHLSWDDDDAAAEARISGMVAGRRIRATMPAP